LGISRFPLLLGRFLLPQPQLLSFPSLSLSALQAPTLSVSSHPSFSESIQDAPAMPDFPKESLLED